MDDREVRLKALELALTHASGITAVSIADIYSKFIIKGLQGEPKPSPKAKKRKATRA